MSVLAHKSPLHDRRSILPTDLRRFIGSTSLCVCKHFQNYHLQKYRQVRRQLNVYAEFFGQGERLNLNMSCAIALRACFYQRFFDFNGHQHVQ